MILWIRVADGSVSKSCEKPTPHNSQFLQKQLDYYDELNEIDDHMEVTQNNELTNINPIQSNHMQQQGNFHPALLPIKQSKLQKPNESINYCNSHHVTQSNPLNA